MRRTKVIYYLRRAVDSKQLKIFYVIRLINIYSYFYNY